MKTTTLIFSGSLLLALSLAAVSAGGQPLVNGDFEADSIYPSPYESLAPGSIALTGWSIGGSGGQIAIEDGVQFGIIPYSGLQWIAFTSGTNVGGSSQGILLQSFPTDVGETNIVRFALTSVGPSGVVSSVVTVSVTDSLGETLATQQFAAPSNAIWSVFQLPFTATGSNATLVIESSPGNSQVIGLDNVVVGVARMIPPPPPPVVGSFTNGDFEIPSVALGTFIPINVGDNRLVGWTIGGPGGNVFLNDQLAGSAPPYSGNQYINLNGGNSQPGATLSQTFLSTIGQPSVLSFSLLQNGPSPAGAMGMTATLTASDGSVLASNRFASVPGGSWSRFQLPFTPTTSNTTVTLTDTSTETQAVDINLDDVAIDAATNLPPPPPPPPPVVGSFTNGDFEIPSVALGTFIPINVGDNRLVGWTIGGPGGNVFLNDQLAGSAPPFSGNQYINLNGGNSQPGATLSQTFLSTIGQPSVLSFSLLQNGPSPAGAMGMTATLTASDGSVLASNRFASVPGGSWSRFQLPFTPTTSNTTVTLTDTSVQTDAVDINLDDVTIDAATNLPPPPPPPPPPVIGPFTNGDFEIPSVALGTFIQINVGDNRLVGWTIGGPGGNVFLNDQLADSAPPFSGNQYINLNGGNSQPGATLSQTFLSTIGQPSVLSFSLLQNGPSPAGAMGMTATLTASDGSVLASNRFASVPGGSWSRFQLPFTPTTSNTTVTLTDTSTQTEAVDINLDDVTINVATSAPSVVPSLVTGAASDLITISGGSPGEKYLISATTNLSDPWAWRPMTEITITNSRQVVPLTGPKHQAQFYRAIKQ